MPSSRLPGFYRLPLAERRRRLLAAAGLPDGALAAVEPGALSLDAADGMIENVVGTYALPFAVAANFVIDGADVLVPMAVEEPSIVAAASNAARMARPGGFTTRVSAPVMIGQIQVTHVVDVDAGAAALRAAAGALVGHARGLVPRLAERGGGPRASRSARSRARAPTAACSSRTCSSTAATRWARTSSTRWARRSPPASPRSPAAGRACASCRTSPTGAPSP